jgi:hypothetical protein
VFGLFVVIVRGFTLLLKWKWIKKEDDNKQQKNTCMLTQIEMLIARLFCCCCCCSYGLWSHVCSNEAGVSLKRWYPHSISPLNLESVLLSNTLVCSYHFRPENGNLVLKIIDIYFNATWCHNSNNNLISSPMWESKLSQFLLLLLASIKEYERLCLYIHNNWLFLSCFRY